LSSKSHLLKELYNALQGPCGEKCAIYTYESLLREVRELGHVLYPQKIEEILKDEREHYAIILKMIEEIEASMLPSIYASGGSQSASSSSLETEETSDEVERPGNFSCKDLEGLIANREIIVFFKPDDPEGRYMEEEVFPMIVEKLTIPWFTVTQSEVKGDEDCKKLFLKYHTGLVTWMYPLVVGLDRGNVSFKFKPTYDLDRDIKDLLSKISAMG